MDRSADACTDFYALACGGLIRNVEIPADKAAWGPAQELQLHTEELLRSMLEKAAAQPGEDPVQKKLGAWYGACMDEAAIEKAGAAPLKPLFALVSKVKDKKTLEAAVIELHKRGISPLFGITSQQDFTPTATTTWTPTPRRRRSAIFTAPTYLDTDAKTTEIRDFYRAHVERMLALTGDKPKAAKTAAEDILRIETALAKLAQDKVVRRDPYQIYHKIDRRGLAEAAKGFPWDEYFKGLGFADIKDVSVNSVSYFSGVDALLAAEKPPRGAATCGGTSSPRRRRASARPSSTSASPCARSSSARRSWSPAGSAACSRPTAPWASSSRRST